MTRRGRIATLADLVLTDLRMPDIDGIGLHEELERTKPRMAQRMIPVSGNAREPRYRRFLSAPPPSGTACRIV